jgi:hypothetical protein
VESGEGGLLGSFSFLAGHAGRGAGETHPPLFLFLSVGAVLPGCRLPLLDLLWLLGGSRAPGRGDVAVVGSSQELSPVA